MVMVEGIPAGSAESTLPSAPERPQLGVIQVLRYGVQIATNIRGTGHCGVDIVGADLVVNRDSTKTLQVDIENNGTLIMRPEVWVDVYDAHGKALGRRQGIKNRIYPGTSVRQLVDLSDLAAGSYRALVIVDAGADNVFGAEYTLDL